MNRDGNGATVPVECERMSPSFPTKLRPLFRRLKRTILREDWVRVPTNSWNRRVWWSGKRREKINFSFLFYPAIPVNRRLKSNFGFLFLRTNSFGEECIRLAWFKKLRSNVSQICKNRNIRWQKHNCCNDRSEENTIKSIQEKLCPSCL